MSHNGGKRIHHLRPARELSQVPRWEPREPNGRKRPSDTSSEANGNVPRTAACTAVSQAIAELVRTRTGRAPTTAKTEMASDLAIVTFGDDKGRSALTIEVRNSLYQAMRADAVAAVEAITGRRVAAYLTDQQHNRDLAMIAFVFGPAA